MIGCGEDVVELVVEFLIGDGMGNCLFALFGELVDGIVGVYDGHQVDERVGVVQCDIGVVL